jgi:hypothetical protein
MKNLTRYLLLLIALFIAYWALSPFWVMYQINHAVETNQADKISKYIDYPTLRLNIKDQLKAKYGQSLGLNNKDSLYGIYGTKIFESFSDEMIESVVNPNTISMLMQGKEMKQGYDAQLGNVQQSDLIKYFALMRGAEVTTKNTIDQSQNQNTNNDGDNKAKFKFTAWNQFNVTIPVAGKYKAEIIFQPKHWTWKIVDMKIIG